MISRERLRTPFFFLYSLPARIWRRLLVGTRTVAIVGSVGKTTCTDLAAECLRGKIPRVGSNTMWGVPKSVLRARPWHRVLLFETGTWAPGDIAFQGHVIRPNVAVILTVSLQHRASFRTIENVAREKASILGTVCPGGVAWLNADDPRVAAMEVPSRVRRRTFGTQAGCDLRASDIRAAWPQRLTFAVHHQGEAAEVRTQLAGSAWLPSVLGAIGAALECGLNLHEAAGAVSRVAPHPARMQPVPLPNGVTLLRDEFKSSPETWHAAIEVLRSGPVGRRWLVATSINETGMRPDERMGFLTKIAEGAADSLLFIGESASTGRAKALRRGFPEDRVWTAGTVRDAVEILRRELRAGDLVLLKGPVRDHLTRIAFELSEDKPRPVQCWREHCGQRWLCDKCPNLFQLVPIAPAARAKD